MAFLKRKKVPDELPELIIDRLEESKKPEEKLQKIENKTEKKSQSENFEKPIEKREIFSANMESEMKFLENQNSKIENDKAFFTKLLNDINNELNNGKTIEEWYKNEFLPKDIVNEMKDYWGSQKKDIILKSIGKNFKEKIENKIEQLKIMESEWQNIYFELIKKEEAIKKEENELKKIISDFVEMCNRRMEKSNEEK